MCEVYAWCPIENDTLPMPGFDLRYTINTFLFIHSWEHRWHSGESSHFSPWSWVQFLDPVSYVILLSLLVLSCVKGFSLGSPVFFSPQKPTLIWSRLCSVARHDSYGGSRRHPCMPSTRPCQAAFHTIHLLSCKWGWLVNPIYLIFIYISFTTFHGSQ